jgi:leucyl-tRNA synthetase
MQRYNPAEIEEKWQKAWDEQGIYNAPDVSDKPNYYALSMFPYPSGNLHIGHWYAFTAPDIHARYMRMKGNNVMQPIGFDAFGLPAENAAIKHGLDPDGWTRQNIQDMLKQFRLTGFSFDMSRVVNTSDPDYYKWTQWLFLKLYERGLAFRKKGMVNWCEHDQTVLANEQVIDGLCWRCDNPVVQKELEQWYFKITEFAEELLEGLDRVDWPDTTKRMQRNWIGKSAGAIVDFHLVVAEGRVDRERTSISVFTTRPDTLFGVSYVVLAPDHPLVPTIIAPENVEIVSAYVQQARHKTERQRLANQDKTGVFTGSFVVHPLSGKQVPIWIADYVLSTYGTGAVMGVPAHDRRDFEFATTHKLPIVPVIDTGNEDRFGGEGIIINSNRYDGMTSQEARVKIIRDLARKGSGRSEVSYRIRDWLISRQRYWGPPIPMIDCKDCGLVPVPEDQLPITLPKDVDFTPKGKPPLATSESFMNTTCPKCEKPAQRVAETLDTFVDSSWYYLRYPDPRNQDQAFSADALRRWLPVDIYVGGVEHAVLHLLYARFVTKALHSMGYLDFDEPFKKLRHQGIILGPDHQKMSKSRGNVVNPDDLVAQFSADAVRMQLVFLGPHEQGGPWDLKGIHGVHRFLNRVWLEQQKRAGTWAKKSDAEVQKSLSDGLKKIADDITAFKFNTAVAELMKIINSVNRAKNMAQEDWESYITALAPFAPFMAEELWHQLGKSDSIHNNKWPEVIVSQEQIERMSDISVQVNGKFRAVITAPIESSEDTVLEGAKALDAVQRHIKGKDIVKHIYVPGKILNLITQ